MSKTDAAKRRELFAEFLYWLFDSFIIHLVRAHFYVTETSTAKNRLFYFRHDVWKKLSEPTFTQLKLDMFVQLSASEEKRIHRESLGVAAVRLLPKDKGVRPIMNLKRKFVDVGAVFLG